jgi:protein TonB
LFQANPIKNPMRIKPLISTLMISVSIHGLILIPFWRFQTLALTVPDKPLKLVLETVKPESAQPLSRPRRTIPEALPKMPPPPAHPKTPEAVTIPKPAAIEPVAKPAVNPRDKAVNPPEFAEAAIAEKPSEVPQAIEPALPVEESKATPAVAEAATGPPKPVTRAETVGTIAEVPVRTPGSEAVKPDVSSVYSQLIFEKIQKSKRYPRLARDRGMEGRILLEFVLSREGKLLDIKVLRSSGFSILDREACLTLRRAAPFPKLPDNVMVGRVALKVNISFHLTD